MYWLQEVDKSKYHPIIVSKTNPSADIYQPRNLGYEASAYLEYILKYYNELPEFTVFVHGHDTAWHQRGRTPDFVNSLPINEHTPHFFNFNNMPLNVLSVNGCYSDIKNMTKFRHIMDPLGINWKDPPEFFITSASAQFIVHRNLIRRLSADTYRALLNNIYAEPTWNQKGVAVMFEWFWSYIFTGEFDEREWLLKHVKDYPPYKDGLGPLKDTDRINEIINTVIERNHKMN